LKILFGPFSSPAEVNKSCILTVHAQQDLLLPLVVEKQPQVVQLQLFVVGFF
jgi:hypothetical protein